MAVSEALRSRGPSLGRETPEGAGCGQRLDLGAGVMAAMVAMAVSRAEASVLPKAPKYDIR